MSKERPKPIEGVDYYVLPGGRTIFTEEYHLKRGYCCNGRCLHCPWKKDKIKKVSSLIVDENGQKLA